MNYTKQEIEEIALKVIEELKWGYDPKEGIRLVFSSMEEQIEDLNKTYKGGFLPKKITYEDAKAKIRPFWSAFFNDIPEAEIYGSTTIIEINDDSGEPYFLRHRQASFNILKNDTDVYYLEKA